MLKKKGTDGTVTEKAEEIVEDVTVAKASEDGDAVEAVNPAQSDADPVGVIEYAQPTKPLKPTSV